MRAVAEELDAFAEQLEGARGVEIGPSGPVLAMRRVPVRHRGTVHRIREQLDGQLPATHPGHICASGPQIECPATGRMRRPDAVVIPEAALDEEGFAVDATQVPAVVEVLPASPHEGFGERPADYAAMHIPHCLVADPFTGTVVAHSDPCHGRYTRKDPYIYGDSVAFGPWTVDTSEFRRYGKPGN
ncbi:Uma2 family endonuclease [Streptomyces puniciscabiei]